MIDLKKLRDSAMQAGAIDQPWYDENDIHGFGCEGEDIDHIANCSPAVILELLDQLEAAQKDAARIDWLESSKDSHGFCHSGNGDYRHYALQMEGYKNVREVIDEAMASKP